MKRTVLRIKHNRNQAHDCGPLNRILSDDLEEEKERVMPQQWGENLAVGKWRRAWNGNGRSVKHTGEYHDWGHIRGLV